ncbi:putative phage abortive infection protein [Arundinibacter roseus]|uniref:Phage abortive infection protein n=1 Tax=Arundinibacter roseus TaxID=2070510 RepID=A0A4R4KAY5_9BACT|nr:putative phage abortive infection protein [Arundinibacter roseus]TDB63309.1 hypothetical protein EZE20_16170 [Arundinibacter roseus]
MNKLIIRISWILIILGGLISFIFIYYTKTDGYVFWGNEKIDFATTGQFGDFLGGVVGTAFSLAGTFLIYLSFKEQTTSNKKEGFETTFFELVNLHRENVNQINYTKYDNGTLRKAEHRKVFRLIFQEFLECFKEVKKFSNSKNIEDYIKPKYNLTLKEIIKKNNLKCDLIEIALIDIAYSIVFFGVGEDGEIILKDRFKRKYNSLFFYQLLKYIKLKPKKENEKRYEIWENLLKLNFKEYKSVNLEYYKYRQHNTIETLSEEAKKLIYKTEFNKYYGGHQHRLGHYFRHLFQCYKYLNYDSDLTENEKYFYGKTLRAQLSTYEQALIFINSISSLGQKWELTPEIDLLKKHSDIANSKLITKYNIIKNLPGHHLLGIRYKSYYPEVKYETEE